MEQTTKRTAEAIQEEYKTLCAELGQIQFQIKVLESRIEAGNQRILALGKELEATAGTATAAAADAPIPTPQTELPNDQTK